MQWISLGLMFLENANWFTTKAKANNHTKHRHLFASTASETRIGSNHDGHTVGEVDDLLTCWSRATRFLKAFYVVPTSLTNEERRVIANNFTLTLSPYGA